MSGFAEVRLSWQFWEHRGVGQGSLAGMEGFAETGLQLSGLRGEVGGDGGGGVGGGCLGGGGEACTLTFRERVEL